MSRPPTRATISLLAATVASLALTVPAHAVPTDVLGGLTGGTSSESGSATGAEGSTASGSTAAPSGRLRRGCHTYTYTYSISVPTEDWTLETSIVDRRGKGVAADAFFGPAHPKSSTSSFRLCRQATVPGKFRIRSTLAWYDDPTTIHSVTVPVTRFRLAR